MPVAVSVTEGPIDTVGLLSELSKDGVGAIASFIGIVRPVNESEKVLSLEFETWDEKLPQVLMDIGNKALNKYNLHSVSITHRKGTVLPVKLLCASMQLRPIERGFCRLQLDNRRIETSSTHLEKRKNSEWLILD